MTVQTRGSGVKRKSYKEEEEASSSRETKHSIKKRPPQKPRNENFTKRNNIQKDGIYPMNKFPYHLNYHVLDFRKQPEFYRWGVGEQGVLMVEPYKSELLPDWKFKDSKIATKSSIALKKHFYNYLEQDDFVGADMARKFIQMGFTRSRRYANHKGGRKYSYKDGMKGKELPKAQVEDKEKAESAQIFKAILEEVKVDKRYIELRKEFETKYKGVVIDASNKSQDSD